MEAKTEIFLTRHIKEKYEKKFERTMEEMTEQIFNLTNEIDGLNRRCSCLRGGDAMIIAYFLLGKSRFTRGRPNVVLQLTK